MAKTVRITIEIDDKGSAKVVGFSKKMKTEAEKGAAASRKAFQDFERRAGAALDNTFRKVARWGALIAVTLAVGAGAAMIKTGAQFEQSMANINAILRPTAIEFENLSGKARELGRTTVFSSAQAAEAMQKLSLAGFKTAEILGVMDDTLALAAAGELDMAEAARITANVMRGLSIPVSKFKDAVNALTFAATNSNQTISDMGHAFKFIGPVANAIKADITELSAALAVLANVGLRGEMAGTGLRRSLTVFLGEIPEGAEGLSKMNLQLERGQDGTFQLADAIDAMTRKGITASDVMKAFGQRAGPAMLALMSAGSDAIRRYRRQIEVLSGANQTLAATIAEMKLDTTIGDFTKLKSVLADLAIEIFVSLGPALRDMLQSARDFTNQAIEWFKVHDALTLVTRVLKIAVALMLTLVGTGIILKIGTLTAAFSKLKLAVMFLNSQLTVANIQAASFMTKAKLGLGALGAASAVGVLSFQFGRLAAEVLGLDRPVQRVFETMLRSSKELVSEVDTAFMEVFNFIKDVPRDVALKFGVDVSEEEFQVLLGSLDKMREKVERAPNVRHYKVALVQLMDQLEPYISNMRKAAAENAAVQRAISTLAPVIEDHTDLWDQAVEKYGETAEAVTEFTRLVEEYNNTTAIEMEKRIQNQAKLLTQLKNKLLDAGIAYETAQVEMELMLQSLNEIAEQKGVEVTDIDVMRAYADEIIRVGQAALKTGQTLSAEFAEPFAVAFEFNVTKEGGLLGDLEAPIEEMRKVWDDAVLSMAVSGVAPVDAMLAAWQLVQEASAQWVLDMEAGKLLVEETTAQMDAIADSFQKLVPTNLFEQAFEGLEENLTTKVIAGMTDSEIGAVVTQELNRIFSEIPIDVLPPEAYQPQLDELMNQWGIAFFQMGIDTEQFALLFEQKILTLVAMMQAAGVPLTAELQAMFDFIKENKIKLYGEDQRDADADRISEIHTQLKDSFMDIMQQAGNDLARLAAEGILGGKNISEQFERMKKRMLSSMIQLLFKYIAARIKASGVETGLSIKENLVAFGGVLAKVFGNVYQSISAIPIVGPALAPAAAAAAFAAVLHFGKKLLTGKGFREGGLVTGPGTGTSDSIFGRLSAGEFVLRSNVVDKLGVGLLNQLNAGLIGPGALVAATAGGPAVATGPSPVPSAGQVLLVQIFQTFTGDNWQENGINDDLRGTIMDATREAIESGTELPFPTETF